MTNFIINNQLGLLVIAFLIGFTIAQFLFFGRAKQAIWLGIDTAWIVFGGAGIFVAVTLGIFGADTSRINRQTDIVYATNSIFVRDARLYQLEYCTDDEPRRQRLCDTVDDMASSARINQSVLPVFFEIDRFNQPLLSSQILRIRDASENNLSGDEPSEVLMVVETNSPAIQTTLARLKSDRAMSGQSAAYLVLAETYDQLVADTNQILMNFQALQKRRTFLVIQVVLLMFVAFFLPLRAAKGFNDLRNLNEALKPS